MGVRDIHIDTNICKLFRCPTHVAGIPCFFGNLKIIYVTQPMFVLFFFSLQEENKAISARKEYKGRTEL